MDFEQARADAKTARRLQLDEDPAMNLTRRLRLSEAVPFGSETSNLPRHRVPGLVAADVFAAPSLLRCCGSVSA